MQRFEDCAHEVHGKNDTHKTRCGCSVSLVHGMSNDMDLPGPFVDQKIASVFAPSFAW